MPTQTARGFPLHALRFCISSPKRRGWRPSRFVRPLNLVTALLLSSCAGSPYRAEKRQCSNSFESPHRRKFGLNALSDDCSREESCLLQHLCLSRSSSKFVEKLMQPVEGESHQLEGWWRHVGRLPAVALHQQNAAQFGSEEFVVHLHLLLGWLQGCCRKDDFAAQRALTNETGA